MLAGVCLLLLVGRGASSAPSKCHSFLTSFNCMNLHLEAVPHPPPNTTLLDLRFNRIKEIKPGTFHHLTNLQSLLLNGNHLHRLKNGDFEGLTNLKTLYLFNNKIRHIEEKAFAHLPHLQQLYLHYNKIDQLHPQLFSNNQNLERLFLFENKITSILPGTFDNLKKLHRLRLDGNALVCDCSLAWLKNLIVQSGSKMHISATCDTPYEMHGKSISEIPDNHLHCSQPTILEGPHDIQVDFGGTVVFRCRVEGDPRPQIKWMLNNHEIEYSSPKYSMKEDGTLVINGMSESDVGVYECVAKSPLGEVKSEPGVAKAPPSARLEFAKRPVNTEANIGDTVQMECSARVEHGGARVVWSKDGDILSHDNSQVSPEGTLTIKRVSTDDAGVYKCTIQDASSQASHEATLTVTLRPSIVTPPKSQSLNAGETIKLRCHANGTPAPSIIWFKDGTSLQPTQNIHFLRENEELIVERAGVGDSGLYTCLAQNIEGSAEASGEVRIRPFGPRPPTFTTLPHTVHAALNTSVEIPCKASGDPPPTLTWTKNGHQLPLDSKRRIFPTGSLRIFEITEEDRGIYECVATNTNGRISARAMLRIEDNWEVSNSLLLQSLEEAENQVDSAVNNTLQSLFAKREEERPPSPHALMRLFRYPDPNARTIVRAADVYEKTLANIRQHVSSGLYINDTQVFNYEALLSPEQLRLLAEHSGCMEHQTANCSDMGYHAKYRTIDGTCNNLQHPYWGASHTAFTRLLKPAYEDGFSSPIGWDKNRVYFGFKKPIARVVSTSLLRTHKVSEDDEITHMVMQWGQFVDHDLDHAIPSTTAESWQGIDCRKSCEYSPPCFPMEVPEGDSRVKNRRCMDFIRSSAICGSGITSVFFDKLQSREQINQLTAFIDGSQVYGFSENRSILLRDYQSGLGLLRVGIFTEHETPLLPTAGSQEVDCRRDPTESDTECFLAGDVRANEQVGLLAMHTLWMREHNRVAIELSDINPHWDNDKLFNEARKIVGAQMQHITYQHWLPQILGPEGMKMLGKYEGYNPNVNPGISNVFATAAFRFGHTLINPVLKRLGPDFKDIPEGDLSLGDAFFSPWRLVKEGGVDPLLRGLFMTPAKKKLPRQNLNDQLTDKLFRFVHAVSLDLASMNVQRGRDHGLPSYNDYRHYCNLSTVDTFSQLKNHISDDLVLLKLEELYGHPGNIDVWVGGILEDQVDGAKFGPTFRCILVDQFKRIRDGDRFWYENSSVFKSGQLAQLRESSLARVLCDNGDNMRRVTHNVFLLPKRQASRVVDCTHIPAMDLKLWYDCKDCKGDNDNSLMEEDKMEKRVDELEVVVNELRRTVKQLKRKMRGMHPGCRDKENKLRKDGESWQPDVCSLCECAGTHVTCTKIHCLPLHCPNQVKRERRCCPVCA